MSGGFGNPKSSGSGLTAAEILWVQTGNAGVVLLTEQSSDPASTSGKGKVYAKTDHHLYYEDQSGTVTRIDTGGGVTVETPSGTVNASNTQFTPTSRPKWVVSDAGTYFEGAGYSWDGTHINMDVAPSAWIRDII